MKEIIKKYSKQISYIDFDKVVEMSPQQKYLLEIELEIRLESFSKEIIEDFKKQVTDY